MTAADVTDFFLTLCERADNNVNVAVDALAAGEAVGIHAPTVFAHVNELKVRGWIEDAPPSPMDGLHVHLSVAGASRSASERLRRSRSAGRGAADERGRG